EDTWTRVQGRFHRRSDGITQKPAVSFALAAVVVAVLAHPEARQHPLKVTAIDAGVRRGAGDVALGPPEERRRVEAFEALVPGLSRLFERHIERDQRLDAWRERRGHGRLRGGTFMPRERDAALDEVAQLAHVAGEAPREERREELGRDGLGLPPVA